MANKKSRRLDEALLQMELVDSLESARALIMAGSVLVNDQRVDKPGSFIPIDANVRLKDTSPFVSRGGEKLWSAVHTLQLEDAFRDATVLDVGASTGGFTDCVLQLGAKKVLALDVGTAQLHWKLRKDPRVVSLENTHIKDFMHHKEHHIGWVVVDVSFTSLSRLIPHIKKAAPDARLLLLVKPQFELPRDKVPDGGVVVNEQDRRAALDMVAESLAVEGYKVQETVDAAVSGRQGNREIFVLANPGGI